MADLEAELFCIYWVKFCFPKMQHSHLFLSQGGNTAQDRKHLFARVAVLVVRQKSR